jgi:glyoxylase-like metal-dependent hydrolase (beta-lactamase superfamily II)
VLRERVSEDIYIFTSDLYAQVTAGAIVTPAGAVVVDTLPFPAEARQMAAFVAQICRSGVRYVILTHYHADHTYGAYLFPQADVVAHARCRALLAQIGVPALEVAQAEAPELEKVVLRLPDITFDDGEMGLRLAGKLIRLIHVPGHTQDSVMVYVEDSRVLFAADTVMPVPSIVDGDIGAFRTSLQKVAALPIENIVQGHGEVILRGEVQDAVEASLAYLDAVEALVAKTIKSGKRKETLRQVSIESCGLSRIPLNGLVQQIHVANLLALYDRMTSP